MVKALQMTMEFVNVEKNGVSPAPAPVSEEMRVHNCIVFFALLELQLQGSAGHLTAPGEYT